jgi:transcriptional regulator with GAF, ATPase, and Fis domain
MDKDFDRPADLPRRGSARSSEGPGEGRMPDVSGHPGVDETSLACMMALVQHLAGETDTTAVLRSLVRVAIRLTGAERGFVVLQAEDGEFQVAVAENFEHADVEKAAFEVSRTLIRKVSETKRIEFLKVAADLEAHPAGLSLAGRGVHAVTCVPIVGSTGTLGVMYLDDRISRSSFGEAHRKMLELFSYQAASALENARNFKNKNRALEAAQEAIRRHRAESEKRLTYRGMVGGSEPMQEVYRRIDMFGPTEEPVVILGDTGTGKDLTARLIHTKSPRAEREFHAINCAGLAESLLESELFGHEKGAFTGADRARPGLFEVAHRGTLFLDEVGEMSQRMQADLLRTLQSGDVRRIGGRETIHVDVRIIAATNRDLHDQVQKGEFRQDLYYRLNVLTLKLPALRERVEDLPLLIGEMMPKLVRDYKTPRFSKSAMRKLMAYAWPGNVRELENVLRRLAVLGLEEIREEHLPPEVLQMARVPERPGTLREAEEQAIKRAMDSAGGNKAEAARILGVDRTTLYAKLKKMGEL